MSITRRVSEFDEIGTTFGLSAAGQKCFLCGKFTHDPAIMWAGGDGHTIYLHHACAQRLSNKLADDVRLLDVQNNIRT